MAIYSDINMFYGYGRKALSTLIKVEDVDAVSNAVSTIYMTLKGERLFLPEFGAEPEVFLFEIIDEITATRILTHMTSELKKWDDRIQLVWEQCQVVGYADNYYYDVKIAYRLKGLGDQIYYYKGQLTKDA